MKVLDLVKIIAEIAPPSLAEDWDPAGLQAGWSSLALDREVKHVLVALEVSTGLIEEALGLGYDFLLVHHPFFEEEDLRARLNKEGLLAYAAHTSFDSVKGGNNDYLAELLGLTDMQDLADFAPDALGRMGKLTTPLSLKDFAALVNEKLDLPKGSLRAAGAKVLDGKLISKVGLCTGSGGDMAFAAAEQGCDVFLTGDLKYHPARAFDEARICVLDAGHYGTEKIFAENMAKQLAERAGGALHVSVSKVNIDPFTIF